MDDTISLRVANRQDIQAILEVSKGIYGGKDYLPHVIHQWFKAQDKYMFVAELQGKVIGFEAATIIDGGHTIVCQSLRIHQEYRGRGYSYQMMSGVIDRTLDIQPGAAKIVRIVVEQDNIPMKTLSRKMGYKAIMERRVCGFENIPKKNSNVFKGMMCCNEVEPLHKLGVEDAVEFALNQRKFDLVFPNNILMVQRQAYELMAENAEFVFKEDDKMFTDLSTEELRQDLIPKSFSHGRKVKRVDCHSWLCHIYTTDRDEFINHMKRQMMVAIEELEQSKEKTEVEVFYTTNLDFDAGVIFKEVLCLEQDDNVTRDLGIVLYEKDL